MKNQLQQNLGKRIQKFRKMQGFSQEEFAEKIGIATNTLSSIETGNSFMTSQTLENILNLLNISAEELFAFSDKNQKDEMYAYILSKLDLIKNNDTHLKLIYNFIKALY